MEINDHENLLPWNAFGEKEAQFPRVVTPLTENENVKAGAGPLCDSGRYTGGNPFLRCFALRGLEASPCMNEAERHKG
ncbi:hypothetical protein [Desulfoluna spongiiphila]|uniref:hypothetical protein n=1 Tax=Desulfoluna spongiiphila TaxID=419481 RepID=UPI00111371DA|nr:hypothetical protein [Desulfoluna spongiiphila]